MRTLLTAVLLLAIPAFATAQDSDVLDTAPVVEMQQSNTAMTSAPAAVEVEAQDADVEVQTQDLPSQDAAEMQEPGSRQWWWLVGAIVVGGLLVALIL